MIAACSRAGALLMYAEELCFAPKYVRAKELADEGALGLGAPGPPGRAALRPARGLVLGSRARGRRRADGHGLPRHRVRALDLRQGRRPIGDRRAGHVRARRRAPRRRTTPSASIRFAGNRLGRGRDELGQAGRDGRPRRADRVGGDHLCRHPARLVAHDLQRARIRLRRREGAADERLDVHDVRGDLELRVPAGDAALRRLRALGQPSPSRRVPTAGRCSRSSTRMYMAAGGAGRVSLPLEISPEIAARPPYLCWKEPAAGRVVGSD